MDGKEFAELRTGLELTQEEMGKRIGVGRVTIARWETGVSPVPEAPATTIRKLAARDVLADLPEIISDDEPEPQLIASGFDPVGRGLQPFTAPSPHPHWETYQPRAGWQRVDGCIRVVSDKIPDPIPYHAPGWAGWRGVVTADGRVFDCDTGHQMRDYRGGHTERRAWSNPKKAKGDK